MLIVCTTHGYMLGEHGFWAKNYMPPYEEVVHTPLFIWDLRAGVRQSAGRAWFRPSTCRPRCSAFSAFRFRKDMQRHDLLPVLLAR